MRAGRSSAARGLLLALPPPVGCATVEAADAQNASSCEMSCTHIGAAGSALLAHCRRIDGDFDRTSILIPGIANINGVLHYQ